MIARERQPRAGSAPAPRRWTQLLGLALRGGVAAIFPVAGIALTTGTSGCTTDAYCFADCTTSSASGQSGTTMSTSGSGGGLTMTGSGGGIQFTTGAGGTCTPTNNGKEVCDGLDNDCNGKVDDVDPTDPHSCGGCPPQGIDCFMTLTNNDPSSITCDSGKCKGTCEPDYYDLDGDGTCEYYCVKVPGATDDKTCNHRDDDCDGQIDEDVDLCGDPNNCGSCNHKCVAAHANTACTHTGNMACDSSNTACVISSCECNGPGDCYWDLDGSFATGCEYKCDKTANYEICGDGIDNDCNGLIDGADDTSHDPQIGIPCFGGTQGVCAEAAHAGVTKCVGDQVVCVGANVLHPGDLQETCNGKDDDCDGVVDNNTTDSGASCGVSSNFPCTLGTMQCTPTTPGDPSTDTLQCIGAVLPGTEVCNGVDDDCDGTIDKHNGQPPADSVGDCNVPAPPPTGMISACQKGAKACVGGQVVCQCPTGFVPCNGNCINPAIATCGSGDTCGVDANCNGIAENQPDTTTDVHNCGGCGIDCYAGKSHENWSCHNSMCQFDGCQTDYWNLDSNPNDCEYFCHFISAQESCNGQDDNCNGQIDEGVIAPSPTQVCGVSPSATAPECKGQNAGGQVNVACVNGSWQCKFPTGVCSGQTACSGASCCQVPEVCEDSLNYPAVQPTSMASPPTGGLDNNCNGLVNENVANWAQPCASDSGQPPPGDGQCKSTGFFYCSTPNAVLCGAKKDLTKATQEVCDGIDNDCDGLVDEPKSAPGSSASYVKPAVVKVSNSLWIMQYEASRPILSAKYPTGSSSTVPGSGNGYFCATAPCPGGAPVAPPGTPLQKTVACSQTGVIPWFNVTPIEAEQTCADRGGHICTTAEWQQTCMGTSGTCNWGYDSTAPSNCTTKGSAAKFCNLDAYTGFGDADELLITASGTLKRCFANWGAAGNVFDITGNLREITKSGTNVYPLMGGSFDSQDENGASCAFDFYEVDTSFELYDTGFRCCWGTDPT